MPRKGAGDQVNTGRSGVLQSSQTRTVVERTIDLFQSYHIYLKLELVYKDLCQIIERERDSLQRFPPVPTNVRESG